MADRKAEIRELGEDDLALMGDVLTLFGEVFEEPETYSGNRPGEDYLKRLLGGEQLIVLAAMKGGEVVGALAAYDLRKFEQARSEIFIYDLSVSEAHRREGIATALIERTREIGKARGAWVVIIQSEADNAAAVRLYSKLGKRESVLSFDIPVERGEGEEV